jgi:hypothetical protein
MLYSISFLVTSPTYLAHLLPTTAINRKLGETWTVTNNIFILIIVNVSVVTHWLFLVSLIWSLLWCSLALLNSYLLANTSLELTTMIISRSWVLLLWWCSVSHTLLTTRVITVFVARLHMLTISISLVKFRISLLIVILTLLFFLKTTFLHLAIITVLILVESFLELILPLFLHKSQSILIKQCLDLTACLCVIWNCSVSSGSVELVNCITFFFFDFNYLLMINLLLVDMLFVILRSSLYRDFMIYKRFRRKL